MMEGIVLERKKQRRGSENENGCEFKNNTLRDFLILRKDAFNIHVKACFLLLQGWAEVTVESSTSRA